MLLTFMLINNRILNSVEINITRRKFMRITKKKKYCKTKNNNIIYFYIRLFFSIEFPLRESYTIGAL